jgi:hypothetical protein
MLYIATIILGFSGDTLIGPSKLARGPLRGQPGLAPYCALSMILPSLLAIFPGRGLIELLLRASNEHILIVRVPRARGQPGCPRFLYLFCRSNSFTT